MADVTITPANVLAQAGALIDSGTAGAALTAGQWVYRDATTKKFLLADADGSAPAKGVVGLVLNNAALNQPVQIAKSGPVTIGGTLVAGSPYYLSGTAGGLAPFADVGAGETSILLGVATSTTTLRIGIINSGVTL